MAYCHTAVYVTIFVYISINIQAVPLGQPVGEPINQNAPGTQLLEDTPPVQNNATLQLDVNTGVVELNQDVVIEDFLRSGKTQHDLETELRKTSLERRRAQIKRQADFYHSRCCYIDVFCIRGCRRRSRNGVL